MRFCYWSYRRINIWIYCLTSFWSFALNKTKIMSKHLFSIGRKKMIFYDTRNSSVDKERSSMCFYWFITNEMASRSNNKIDYLLLVDRQNSCFNVSNKNILYWSKRLFYLTSLKMFKRININIHISKQDKNVDLKLYYFHCYLLKHVSFV